jgi:hypothetical protein
MPPVSSPRRKAPAFRGPRSDPRNGQRNGYRPGNGTRPRPGGAEKPEHEILFQTYFKSVGPRTYAAQVKKASNDNQYLVLTEGKRDEKTGEVRKARLFVYSEDFVAFFRMLQETSLFIKANPLPEEVKQRRDKFWAKKEGERKALPAAAPAASPVTVASPAPVATAAPGAKAPRPGAGPLKATPNARG